MLIFDDVLQCGSRRFAFQLIFVNFEVRCANLFGWNGFISGSMGLFFDQFPDVESIFVLILSRIDLF